MVAIDSMVNIVPLLNPGRGLLLLLVLTEAHLNFDLLAVQFATHLRDFCHDHQYLMGVSDSGRTLGFGNQQCPDAHTQELDWSSSDHISQFGHLNHRQLSYQTYLYLGFLH